MCADDVVCTGAEPLFFLDYLAVGRVVPERVAAIVEGVAEGCRRAGCALLGGETAEHPGVMPDDQFDLAGFCVGVVDEADLLGPARVRDGDVLIGLASSGLHANGYSLVRKALEALRPRRKLPRGSRGRSPTSCWSPARSTRPRSCRWLATGLLHAAAHITGGGFLENIPRALPPGHRARRSAGVRGRSPPIFALVQAASDASDDDMFSTFNMGVGMVLVVDPSDAEEVLGRNDPGRSRSARRDRAPASRSPEGPPGPSPVLIRAD